MKDNTFNQRGSSDTKTKPMSYSNDREEWGFVYVEMFIYMKRKTHREQMKSRVIGDICHFCGQEIDRDIFFKHAAQFAKDNNMPNLAKLLKMRYENKKDSEEEATRAKHAPK
jgi:hypothetical protein